MKNIIISMLAVMIFAACENKQKKENIVSKSALDFKYTIVSGGNDLLNSSSEFSESVFSKDVAFKIAGAVYDGKLGVDEATLQELRKLEKSQVQKNLAPSYALKSEREKLLSVEFLSDVVVDIDSDESMWNYYDNIEWLTHTGFDYGTEAVVYAFPNAYFSFRYYPVEGVGYLPGILAVFKGKDGAWYCVKSSPLRGSVNGSTFVVDGAEDLKLYVDWGHVRLEQAGETVFEGLFDVFGSKDFKLCKGTKAENIYTRKLK